MAFLLRDEVRYEGPDPMDDAEQIDAHDPLPRRQRELPRRAAPAHARVIADHVDRAEPVEGGTAQVVDRRRIADIGHRSGGLDAVGPEAGGGRDERGFIDVRHHHAHTVGTEAPADGQADPAGRAGDHCNSAREITHRFLSFGTWMTRARKIIRRPWAGCQRALCS